MDVATGSLVVSTTTTSPNYTATVAAGKTYRWNVAAGNAAGLSPYTTVVYFQTPAAVVLPAMPTNPSPVTTITDQQKENAMLVIVNNRRGTLPAEFVLAGGISKKAVRGHSMLRDITTTHFTALPAVLGHSQLMAMESCRSLRQRLPSGSGAYTNDQTGYDHAINDGTDYLKALYNQYGTLWQTALHYNTGPKQPVHLQEQYGHSSIPEWRGFGNSEPRSPNV